MWLLALKFLANLNALLLDGIKKKLQILEKGGMEKIPSTRGFKLLTLTLKIELPIQFKYADKVFIIRNSRELEYKIG